MSLAESAQGLKLLRVKLGHKLEDLGPDGIHSTCRVEVEPIVFGSLRPKPFECLLNLGGQVGFTLVHRYAHFAVFDDHVVADS